jgi:hypothetical protein
MHHGPWTWCDSIAGEVWAPADVCLWIAGMLPEGLALSLALEGLQLCPAGLKKKEYFNAATDTTLPYDALVAKSFEFLIELPAKVKARTS